MASSETPRRFNWRALTSTTLIFSFVVTAFTGLVLLLDKHQGFAGLNHGVYEGIHKYVCVLMVIVGVVHIVFNWKPLVNHFKAKTKGMRWEWVVGLLLTILATAGALTLGAKGHERAMQGGPGGAPGMSQQGGPGAPGGEAGAPGGDAH